MGKQNVPPKHVQEKFNELLDILDNSTIDSTIKNEISTKITEVQDTLRTCNMHYKLIFEQATFPIAEMNFSLVKKRLTEVKITKSSQIDSYLLENPSFIFEIINLIIYTAANKKTLDLYKANNLEEVKRNTINLYKEDPNRKIVQSILKNLLDNKNEFDFDEIYTGQDGSERFVKRHCYVPVNAINDWSVVFGSTIDITNVKTLSAELREKNELWNKFLKAIPDFIFILDSNFTFIETNLTEDQSARIFGSKIIGKKLFDVFPALLGLDLRERYYDVMSTGKSVKFEDFKFNNGFYTIEAIKVGTGIALVVTDKTELRKAEFELKLKDNLVSNSPDAVFLCDKDANFIYVNRIACESLGYKEKELLKLKPPNITTFFDDNTWADFWFESKSNGSIVVNTVHIRKDKTTFPIEVKTKYIKYENDEFLCVFIRDITERINAEQQKLENERKFRVLYDNSPTGIYEFDLTETFTLLAKIRKKVKRNYMEYFKNNADIVFKVRDSMKIVNVNPAMVQLLGAQSENEVKERFSDLVIPLTVKGYNKIFLALLEERDYVRTQLIVRNFQGKQLTLDVIVNLPTINSENKTAIASINDNTERIKLIQDLEESQERYQSLFFNIPIDVFEFDFTKVKSKLNDLKNKNIIDIKTFFENNLNVLFDIFGSVRVIEYNKFPKTSENQIVLKSFVNNYRKMFDQKSIPGLIQLFSKLYNGLMKDSFEIMHIEGNLVDVNHFAGMFFIPEQNRTLWDKVIISGFSISDRVKMERDLKDGKEFLEKIMNSSPNSILVFDSDYKLVHINDIGVERTGVSREKAIGQHISKFNPLFDSSRLKKYDEVLKTGKSIEIPITSKINDGLNQHYIVKVFKIGEGIGFISTNITELKEKELELEEKAFHLRERLKELNLLYEITNYPIDSEKPITKFFNYIIERIPPAMLYPEITSARIIFDKKSFCSDNFKESKWCLSSHIKAEDKILGRVEIFYGEDKEQRDYGPFMKKEKELVEGISRKITDYFNFSNAQRELRLQRETIENNPSAIIWVNSKGKVVKYNSTVRKFITFEDLDSLNKQIGMIYPIFGSDEWFEQTFETFREEGSYTTEYFYKPTEDVTIPLEIKNFHFKFEDEEYICAIITDITERKNFESQILESEEKFRKYTEHSPFGIMIYSHHKCLYANTAAKEFFQCTDDTDVSQINILNFIKDPYEIKAIDKRHVKYNEDNQQDSDTRYMKVTLAPGNDKWISSRATPIEIDGEPAMLFTFIDVTKEKVFEESLSAEKERLIVTLRSIGDGVIVTDQTGNITLINSVAESMTGYQQIDVKGRNINDILEISDDTSKNKSIIDFNFMLKNKGASSFIKEGLFISKYGVKIFMEINANVIKDSDRQVIGLVVVIRDITMRKKSEDELLKLQKLESIGFLAGGIAHDFNNILSAVLTNVSFTKLLADSEDDYTKIYKRLDEIENAIISTKGLTNQLLTFSKGGEPIKSIVQLDELLHNTVEFSLSGSKIKAKYRIEKGLLPVEIDETQFSQVLNNIVVNSIEAMPKGGSIEIDASNVHIDNEFLQLRLGKYVKVTIRDHGKGISDDILSKIFDPYFTTKKTGSGLGLAVAYKVIRNHGGAIDVESIVGKGTAFHIYIPCLEENAYVKPLGIQDVVESSEKPKILVMDDKEMILEIVTTSLEHLGYEVDIALKGEEAIEKYSKSMKSGKKFDVVIIDLTIPDGMGGLETIRKLKQIDSSIKAIVSSGYSDDPIMANYENYGFVNVLPKPYNVKDVQKIIEDTYREEE